MPRITADILEIAILARIADILSHVIHGFPNSFFLRVIEKNEKVSTGEITHLSRQKKT